MKLIKQTEGAADLLAADLSNALAEHQRVIWLLSGGSNVSISVAAMRQLDPALTRRLIIMQLDERFVAADSPDRNWQQLLTAGFDTRQATVLPVELDGKRTLEQTVAAYRTTIDEQFGQADCIIAQFGIGADGHTAGILPGSPAATASDSVVGYEGPDFIRISLTFPALRRISMARAFAYGNDKRAALEALAAGGQPLTALPAGILRDIPDSTVYNDQLERQAV